MEYINVGSIFLTLATVLIPIFIRAKYNRIKISEQIRRFVLHKLTVTVDETACLLTLASPKSKDEFVIAIGATLPGSDTFDVYRDKNKLEIIWPDYATLVLGHREKTDASFYDVSWQARHTSLSTFESCVNLSDAHWYGGGTTFKQDYPLGRWNTRLAPYIAGTPTGSIFGADYFGTIQERFWLSSNGVGLYVYPDVPLFLSVNDTSDGVLKLVSKQSRIFENSFNAPLSLKYTVCYSKDMIDAYKACAGEFFSLPENAPAKDMFQYPSWWIGSGGSELSIHDIKATSSELIANNFQGSLLKLKGRWYKNIGDWEFDEERFPGESAENVMKELHEKRFRAVVEFYPFLSPSAVSYPRESEMVLRNRLTGWPTLTKFKNQEVAILDVTKPKVRESLSHSIKVLRDHFKVDGFCFIGVEPHLCRHPVSFAKDFLRGLNPSGCDYVCDEDKRMSSSDIAVDSQHLPIFVNLRPKRPSWDKHNGIQTVIPQVLTMGLMGYPFVNPGPVGGEYGTGDVLDKELYIRWVQLVTLMPHMEFSIPPWRLGSAALEITQKMCALHKKYSEKMIQLAQEATETGEPIVRPLWWIAPKDAVALTSSSQFLLGSDVMVAPVLKQGARSRDIYFPAGTWREELHNNVVTGPRWERNFPVNLGELLYFTLLNR